MRGLSTLAAMAAMSGLALPQAHGEIRPMRRQYQPPIRLDTREAAEAKRARKRAKRAALTSTGGK